MKSRQNIFGAPIADRCGIERADDDWVRAQRALPTARFIIFSGLRCLASEAPAVVRLASADLPFGWETWPSIFLGSENETPLFALVVSDSDAREFAPQGEFVELRAVATSLAPHDAAVVVHARAVLHWHALNRHCGGCGKPLQRAAAGHALRCLDAACAVQEFYPRIDPAVIVLVTHGEHCLLGRQAGWPQGRYSCLAGFMEAGETLEETVRREVHEEAGVIVDDIRYHSSQPWPFPQSLMIGFSARAKSRDITLHDDELEDARWFSRADIRTGLENGSLRLSSRLSIAWRLLHDWYAEQDDPELLERYGD